MVAMFNSAKSDSLQYHLLGSYLKDNYSIEYKSDDLLLVPEKETNFCHLNFRAISKNRTCGTAPFSMHRPV